jgi:hypothetical protein
MEYSLLFWALAAICNACMDTLKHHYDSSIFFRKFGRLNGFWNEDAKDAHPYYLPYSKYKLNAWHLLKSTMIILFALSALSAWISGPPLFNIWWFYLLALAWYGLIWNGVFNLFYNCILR